VVEHLPVDVSAIIDREEVRRVCSVTLHVRPLFLPQKECSTALEPQQSCPGGTPPGVASCSRYVVGLGRDLRGGFFCQRRPPSNVNVRAHTGGNSMAWMRSRKAA
jgi:hypothetical protein